MAKRRKARRASKSQGITLNWAIVGLIVVIALLIGLWQINGKPESKARTYWPQVVSALNADVRLDGSVNASWRVAKLDPAYQILGWRVVTTPGGATKSEFIDLNANQVNTTVLRGQIESLYYATVNVPAMVVAARGTVQVMPIIKHQSYAPSSVEVPSAGMTTNAILNYKVSY